MSRGRVEVGHEEVGRPVEDAGLGVGYVLVHLVSRDIRRRRALLSKLESVLGVAHLSPQTPLEVLVAVVHDLLGDDPSMLDLVRVDVHRRDADVGLDHVIMVRIDADGVCPLCRRVQTVSRRFQPGAVSARFPLFLFLLLLIYLTKLNRKSLIL